MWGQNTEQAKRQGHSVLRSHVWANGRNHGLAVRVLPFHARSVTVMLLAQEGTESEEREGHARASSGEFPKIALLPPTGNTVSVSVL